MEKSDAEDEDEGERATSNSKVSVVIIKYNKIIKWEKNKNRRLLEKFYIFKCFEKQQKKQQKNQQKKQQREQHN